MYETSFDIKVTVLPLTKPPQLFIIIIIRDIRSNDLVEW